MKIIVGLGNPGKKYETTRHNVGFLVIDGYLKGLQMISCQSKFNAQICEYQTPTPDGSLEKVLFVKPQSFMNASGSVVNELIQFYKLSPQDDVLVIHDEKDLPVGTIRTTNASSSAGHNGVQDIIDELGTNQFHRIRIGVESRPPGSPIPTDVFVLSNFAADELKQLQDNVFKNAYQEITSFINKKQSR